MIDLEAEKAKNKKWEIWGHEAIGKIMIYESQQGAWMAEAIKS